MTALPPEVGRAAEPVGVGGFEIGYVTDDGLEVLTPFTKELVTVG